MSQHANAVHREDFDRYMVPVYSPPRSFPYAGKAPVYGTSTEKSISTSLAVSR